MAKSPPGYSDASFWRKLQRFARFAGRQVVEKALVLYYAANSPDTPAWAKTTIYAALAYFILPTDLVPDFLPIAGYGDDLAALVTALGAVTSSITPEVQTQARAKLAEWFPPASAKDAKSALDSASAAE
jgi:uncharacterized membrane protein YkvA (DUF1232 family)